MHTLVIKNLRKDFGRLPALRQVSLTIGEGEIFGYLGPNGAGKTTTLRIAMGLIRPTGGSVELLGKNPRDRSSRMNAGYLPGELNLYGSMKAEAVLDYFAGFRPGQPPLLRKHLIEIFDLNAGDLSKRVKFLSHGTRQKLGLIIAMQHDPKLMLLDEPTTGLDPLVQKSLHEFLIGRARQGHTVFFSSHVLSEVEALCENVAILREGELVAVESIENLRRKMVRRLHIRFHGDAPSDIKKQPSVVRSEVNGNEVNLLIHGDINPLIGFLSGHQIEHLVFPEPELEDIFLTYYRNHNLRGDA